MDLNEINKIFESLTLNSEVKNDILKLIQLKTDSDMNTLSQDIKNLNLEIKHLNDNFNSRLDSFKWTIGIGISIIAVILTVIALR